MRLTGSHGWGISTPFPIRRTLANGRILISFGLMRTSTLCASTTICLSPIGRLRLDAAVAQDALNWSAAAPSAWRYRPAPNARRAHPLWPADDLPASPISRRIQGGEKFNWFYNDGTSAFAQRLPSFSDGPESIGKDREFGEHRGEPLDQRQQSHLRHCGDQLVEHAALTEQRVGAPLGGV